jgi:glycosyltransferase involved in cell wall biosynthesis
MCVCQLALVSVVGMNTLPRLSIVTICYNAQHLLRRTMESVLEQMHSYPNLEYMVIDGGSKDGTASIIQEYEAQLAWWVSERDSGVTEAFNKGIARHTGEYIGFLNAGDYFYRSDALSTLFTQAADTQAASATPAASITTQGQPSTKTYPEIVYGQARLTFDPPQHGRTESIVGVAHRPLHKLPTAHQAIFYHRSMWERYGTFSMDYRYAMDYEHYLRFRRDSSVRYAFAEVIVAERPLTLARNSFGNPSRTYREYLKADMAHRNAGVFFNLAKYFRDLIGEGLRKK